MNKQQQTETSTLTAREAEKHLQSVLGEPDGFWRLFLQNNRRGDRTPEWKIPFAVVRGRPVYQRQDLDAFIDHQKRRSLARGQVPAKLDDALKEIGGWPTGRPLDLDVMPQMEEGTGIGYLKIIIANPFLMYRVDVDQARSIAEHLLSAAATIERITNESGDAP